jgi:FlaA1/EpsC-like NDP-sugar epimerase
LGKGGGVFILDLGTVILPYRVNMGEPVNIENMAKGMIRMMGFSLEDIKIDYTGLKPGEKLSEELLVNDTVKDTKYESITVAGVTKVNWEEFESNVDKLIHFAYEGNVDASIRMLKKLVPEYIPQNEVYQIILGK